MTILIALDKFKGSLTAAQACNIAEETLREIHPDWTLLTAPLTDGGEGFCEILTNAAQGKVESLEVSGPDFGQQTAQLGWVEAKNLPESVRQTLNLRTSGRIAIIEMAQASGLELLAKEQRNPWHTSSIGTGQLILSAADKGAEAILLGIGGSATNDLGLGALEALGLQGLNEQFQPIPQLRPSLWHQVQRLSGDILPHIPPIFIACDVNNPLLGPNGCTRIFGPQKGLPAEDLNRMEKCLGDMAKQLCHHFNQPRSLMMQTGAGAAGGIAFGLQAACDAVIIPGFPLVSEWLDLKGKINKADRVLTGEGRFDLTSLQGKGPGSLVHEAAQAGKKIHILAGAVEANLKLPPQVESIHAITPPGLPLKEALAQAPELLVQSVRKHLHIPA